MTKLVAKRNGPKFRVGQVVRVYAMRRYYNRVIECLASEGRVRLNKPIISFYWWSVDDLRPARERGGK